MSIILRILLLIVSILTFIYIIRKLRKAQVQIADVVFWLFFSLILLLMSIFPSSIIYMTKLLGVLSPVNFVYLVMIFLLFIRCFLLSIRVSCLEEKLKNLVEELAILEILKNEKTKQ